MTPTGGPAKLGFPAIGTTATVLVTDAGQMDAAVAILRQELDAIDLAASRFRPDSELCALNAAAGRPVAVSDLLFRAIGEAVRAARVTDGLVDPTVGEALVLAGYDRDFDQIDPAGPPIAVLAKPVPGWKAITTDPTRRTVRLPPGVVLDLGATAKALCADLAATRIAGVTGAGVLVSLGGDMAVAGEPPDDGWSVRVTDDHAAPPDQAAGPVVALRSGGLATSSTTVRRWVRGGVPMHHLIDPETGQPAKGCWRTVSVAAGSCLDANIASCAAMLLGPAAPGWMEERALPARLVDTLGSVTHVAGWPWAEACVPGKEPASC